MADERLQEFLGEVAGGVEFPALARYLEQVVRRLEEDVPVQHLTQTILKDYSITLKILCSANSALHNRASRPILSVSHAVTLLGIETVRDIVAGLALLGSFTRGSKGVRELILLSLLSAHHAREVATHVGYRNTEEAYLCGMFRNLGEVLVARFRPREYAAILLQHEEAIPVTQASLDILGFTFEDAARSVTTNWRIPDSVRECMKEPVIRLRKRPTDDGESLESIVHFAHRLTNAVYRREPDGARASVNLLVNSFGIALGLKHENVKAIVDRALKESEDVFEAMGVPVDRLRLKRQMEAALAEADPVTDTACELGSH
jgi:HD-like signal output (HDOD) protein